MDSSLAPANLPGVLGSIDCGGTTTWASYNAGLDAGVQADDMTIQDGCQLHRPRELREGLQVLVEGLTTTGLTFETTPAALVDVFRVTSGAALILLAAAVNPAILIPAAGALILETEDGPILSTTAAAPLIQCAANSTLTWKARDRVTLAGPVIAGAASATCDITHDDTIPRPNFTAFGFVGTVNETRASLAAWAEPASGPTASRPVPPNVDVGQLYFDTTLGSPVMWNGSAWLLLLPGAPGQPGYNPAWYALTDVYLDPVGGNDANSGAVGFPVKTMAEIIRRYGSDSPAMNFGQSVTVHQLTAQTAGVDAFFFEPKCSGGGSFLWLATPAAVGGPFSPVSVTAKVQTSAGTDLLLNGGLPGGVAVGQLVYNVTKNSYGFVVGLAAGNATVSQPFAAPALTTPALSPVATEDNTWAALDVYQLTQPLLLNWKDAGAYGGDATAGGYLWVEGVRIPDPGVSVWSCAVRGISTTFSLCWWDAFASFDGTSSYGFHVLSCVVSGGVTLRGRVAFVGGAMNLAGTSTVGLYNNCAIDGDCIVNGAVTVYNGQCQLGAVHFSGAVGVVGGSVVYSFAGAIVWGAGSMNLGETDASYYNGVGLWTSFLKLATLLLNGGGTGSSFNASAVGNPYVAGIPITTANLDTGGGVGNPGLQNPRTGCRYGSI